MSTIKVDTINTRTGSGNITFSRPTVLTAGDIVEADLADNSVTLAKMAGGTDGQIITYSASGDPVAVGPGISGQVLTSAGTGAPPTFASAGGGAYTFISSVTASTTTNIEFTDDINSTYNTYFFLLENLDHSADGKLVVQLGIGAGPTYKTADYDYAGQAPSSTSSSYNSRSAHAASYIKLSNAGASDSQFSGSRWNGYLYLYHPSDTAALTYTQSCITTNDESGGIRLSIHAVAGCWHGGVTSPSHTAITAIKFYQTSSTGNFTTGKISMYGISTI